MNSWPYNRIDTHDADARGRYTSQYASADNLKALTTLWAERVQSLEDAAWTVLTDRWLDVAEGQQLDELGAVVGEPRRGRLDDTYREAINTRISINASGGEPEIIIEFLVRVAGAETVLFQEAYPAKIEVYVGGDVSTNLINNLKDIAPAAVGTIYVSETGNLTPFGTIDGVNLSEYTYTFSDGGVWGHGETVLTQYQIEPITDSAAVQGIVDGFGELGFHIIDDGMGDIINLSGNTVLGGNDITDPILPDDGGTIAELYEV